MPLSDYGPWVEVSKQEAARAPQEFIVTLVHGDDEDNWAASAGYHFVNVVSYWRTGKPVPADLFVKDVWYDEKGCPTEG